MSLTFDQKSAILPVRCGKTKGTCFITSGGIIISAHHIVFDYFRNGVKPIIEFHGKSYECDAELLKKGIDIVVLICPRLLLALSACGNNGLPLLPIPVEKTIGQSHIIGGYPQELGLGIDLIEITIEPKAILTTKGKYDVVTMRSDNFSFTRYDGYSGSPVINKLGYVVGVAVVEISNKVAFVSIESIKTLLKKYKIPFEERWQRHDPSSSGIYKCQELLKKAIETAGSRYLDLVHVNNPKFDESVKDFWSYRRYELRKRKLTEIEAKFSAIKAGYKAEDFDDLDRAIKTALRHPDFIAKKDSLSLLAKIMESTLRHYKMSESKVMMVVGKAGTGKTHLSCNLAKKLIEDENHNAYILFGSMFDEHTNAVERFYSLLDFNKESIKKLDDDCKQRKQFAVFIIDALNEGAGDSYWRDNLPLLINELRPFENIKLFITIRSPFAQKILSKCKDELWLKFELKGFSTTKEKEAEGKFFREYGVDLAHTAKFRKEFRNPLFLYIFCRAYAEMSPEEKTKISHVRLYELYLKTRNENVSEIAEEDSFRNVTLQLMKKLAWKSVVDFESNVVSRSVSRREADALCPFRTWKNNLLRAMLVENLLMPVAGNNGENDYLMFEFENMADFLKADQLLNSKLTDNQIVQLLVRTDEFYKKNNSKSRAKFDNMLGALLAIWNRKNSILQDVISRIDNISDCISVARTYTCEINNRFLKDWMSKLDRDSDFQRIIYGIFDITRGELLDWHTKMSLLSVKERDSSWTIEVNNFFDHSNGFERLEHYTLRNDKYEWVAIVLIWMLTTSYPEGHAFVTYLLRRMFRKEPTLMNEMLERFSQVNDSYIHYGLLRAIYGCLLLTRDPILASDVTRKVLSVYFRDREPRPDNVIRDLVLRMVYQCLNLDAEISTQEFALPPFNSTIPRKIPKHTDYNDTFFGDNKAGFLVYHTLDRNSDFNRYILRSNWYSVNQLFVNIKDDGTIEEIPISDIVSMIAKRIRDKFDFTKEIAAFDTQIQSYNRMENFRERIGKKYVWIATNEVYAGLMDNYDVIDPDFRYKTDYPRYAEIRYPWYSDIINRLDPNLESDNKLRELCQIKFDNKAAIGLEPLLVLRDQTGMEWIQIVCFDSRKIQENDVSFDTVTYCNGCFCRADEMFEIDKWASKKDFTGRWMPENDEHYEFLWNEYPWFDMAKRNTNREWKTENGSPKVLVAYEAQLQEDTMGIRENINSHVAYAPNVEMMEVCGLYTAERGLVRTKEDDSIVAINRCPYYDENPGLYIRKDILLKYLKMKKLVLYNFVLCTKTAKKANVVCGDFSGCWRYDISQNWKEIQQIHEIPLNNNHN